MTYPPQQPGPGGWGQQPGGNPNVPPGTPQQQPTWYGNQHAQQQPGIGQQPMQPGQPMAPQVPPSPNWGNEFRQDNWLSGPGGFSDVDVRERKSKAPLILGIVAGLVLLAGGGFGAMFLFSGPGEAQPAAQAVLDKVNAGNLDALGSDLCASKRAELQSQLSRAQARPRMRPNATTTATVSAPA